MDDQSSPMVQVGRVIRVFSNLRCVGIKVSGGGFGKGDRLHFETHRRDFPDCTITASSIEINRQPVNRVSAGDKCAMQIPVEATRDLPPCGTLVFLAGEE